MSALSSVNSSKLILELTSASEIVSNNESVFFSAASVSMFSSGNGHVMHLSFKNDLKI